MGGKGRLSLSPLPQSCASQSPFIVLAAPEHQASRVQCSPQGQCRWELGSSWLSVKSFGRYPTPAFGRGGLCLQILILVGLLEMEWGPLLSTPTRHQIVDCLALPVCSLLLCALSPPNIQRPLYYFSIFSLCFLGFLHVKKWTYYPFKELWGEEVIDTCG